MKSDFYNGKICSNLVTNLGDWAAVLYLRNIVVGVMSIMVIHLTVLMFWGWIGD